MPKALILLILLSLIAIALFVWLEERPAPNVVFILVDTLRADRLDAQRDGTPITPFLSAMRDKALAFDHALSPCSWTKPAMASLFSSLDVDAHEIYYSAEAGAQGYVGQALPETMETMAEYFVRHGYSTWAYQSNANLTQAQGFAQGFHPEDYHYHNGAPGNYVTDSALEAVSSLKPPFFMYCHYMDPHAPYTPPEDCLKLFPTALALTEEEEALLQPEAFMNMVLAQGERTTPHLSEAAKEEARRRYDAEVRFADQQIARLVEQLEQQVPNTLFVVLSDHGEEFWERGGMGHGTTLFEEQEHVPFFIRGPRIAAQRIQESVSTLDLLPTLAALLNFAPAPQWQGKSLLDRAALGERPVYARTMGSWPKQGIDTEAVWVQEKKMIFDHAEGDKAIYDLRIDPEEATNRLKEEAEISTRLEHLSEIRRAENLSRTDSSSVQARPDLAQENTEALISLGYLGGDAAPSQAPMNVILLIIDTLRGDRIHGTRNGIPIMPALAQLAQRSWYYEEAVAQATWTKPSVVSILTGLYPQTHHTQFGVQQQMVSNQHMVVQGVPKRIPNMAQFLKQAGYATACVQTNVHLQEQYDFNRGFDIYQMDRFLPANKVTDKSLKILEKTQGPFFLYAHYFDPHATYDPPAPYREIFGPLPEITERDRSLLEAEQYHQGYYLDRLLFDLALRKERKYSDFSEAGREYIRQSYDGECRYTDREVGRLIRRVRAQHPNTMIIVVADHGEEFWEHGSIGHGKTVYRELTHVPLMIALPEAAPRRVSTPVQTIDILPTIAGCLNLAPDPNWQGRDLGALGEDEGLVESPVFSQTRSSLPEAKLHLEMVREGNEKLIKDHSAQSEAYYDLGKDPMEQKNLLEAGGTIPEEIKAYLDAHHEALKEHPYAEEKAVPYRLDDSTWEELESLGYVQGDSSDSFHPQRETVDY